MVSCVPAESLKCICKPRGDDNGQRPRVPTLSVGGGDEEIDCVLDQLSGLSHLRSPWSAIPASSGRATGRSLV